WMLDSPVRGSKRPSSDGPSRSRDRGPASASCIALGSDRDEDPRWTPESSGGPADVLEEQRARLDVDYIRSIVGILEQALGQSDLALARNSPWPTHTDFRS